MTDTLNSSLNIDFGEASNKGVKNENQDFCSMQVTTGAERQLKGIAFAMADGISTSSVSKIASVSAVNTFLNDYYCTNDALTVKAAGQQVIQAINAWLLAQSRQSEFRFDRDRGYVCTFAAIIFKGQHAHLFSIGDTRIYRVLKEGLEVLTADHRVWISQKESFLSRALGAHDEAEIDYHCIPIEAQDSFIVATDGLYEFIDAKAVADEIINSKDLTKSALDLVQQALNNGSDDNLSIQIARVNSVEQQLSSPVEDELSQLDFPPIFEARDEIDDYVIERKIHSSSRSHVYLAKHKKNNDSLAIKVPSVDLRDDESYLERFMLEEWIARRITSPHVLKAYNGKVYKSKLYTVCEYIQGQSLRQWLTDNPKPSLTQVRSIIEQVALGLNAFHRLEMVHQDIRPDNIMIDEQGTVKIIDFGSTRVAGLMEYSPAMQEEAILGTALFTAPEYFVGHTGTDSSDQFSLGVLTYYLLSGNFPYGNAVSQKRTNAQQKKLKYRSLCDQELNIPVWIDHAIAKAVHIVPHKRYEALSEFIFDLHQPNKHYLRRTRPPLADRHPVMFWQGVSAVLTVIICILLAL